MLLSGSVVVLDNNMPDICCMKAMLAKATLPARSGTIAAAAGTRGWIGGTGFNIAEATGVMIGAGLVMAGAEATTAGKEAGNTANGVAVGWRGKTCGTAGGGAGAGGDAGLTFGKPADAREVGTLGVSSWGHAKTGGGRASNTEHGAKVLSNTERCGKPVATAGGATGGALSFGDGAGTVASTTGGGLGVN